MTPRFRRFSLLVLIGTAAVAAVLAFTFRQVAEENLREMRAEQNVELARSMSNALADDVVELTAIAETNSWSEMQRSPAIAEFAERIRVKIENLTVFRVNIFAPDGLTLYSTMSDRIGSRVVLNPGIEMAAQGEENSMIVRRNAFNAYDREIEPRDMIESYVPLRDRDGNVIGVFEIYSDITPLLARIDKTQRRIVIIVAAAMGVLYLLLELLFWRTASQLRASRRAAELPRDVADAVSAGKAEFVATISHEIRTPLNAVLGMTDLLNLTNLTRKQRDYIGTIQSSGDMLLSLVDNLLDFSHMETGELTLRKSDFDVVDLLERVLRIMGHAAYSKGIELVGVIQHDLGLRISADKRRLEQILVNVVNNAVKFTERGEVVVEFGLDEQSSDDDLRLRVTVRDTGRGIDEKTREQLFMAFASGRRPESSQTYGSGLGLTICKRLLDSMGGAIDIGSRDEGGTTVSFDVPVKRVSSPSADDLIAVAGGRPNRVLSIHSNKAAARSVCNLLGKWGMRCETVFEAGEGLHRLRAAASGGNPYGCVIIDSAIDRSDKLVLARRIRNADETARIPIVLLTSIAEPLGIGEVSELGGVTCVNKPVLPLELRYKLLRAVEGDGVADFDRDLARRAADGESIRILVAEDNPVSSGLLQNMLQSEGYAADVVDNGPAVLERVKEGSYDLLLLDCQMPGMDGDLVTREIRKKPEVYGKQPVIVAVTADTTESHREQCFASGMDDFVPKPVRLDTLRANLPRWTTLAAARGQQDAESALFDLRRSLIEKTGRDDDSFLSDYIGLFLQDAESRLGKMSTALGDRDYKLLRREGHALKGSCLELGADRMARFCEDLSVAAQTGNADEMAKVVGKLGQEFARLKPVYESAKVSVH